MARVVKHTNYRVEVIPEMWPHNIDDPKWALIFAEELKSSIRRHCDVANATVYFDREAVCSFCGYDWETNENGIPCCCEKAIIEHKEVPCGTE